MNAASLTTKKITRATFKKFVTEADADLYIQVKSAFDGMTDGCETVKGDFIPAVRGTEPINDNPYTLGIKGVWLVGSSRDYFSFFEDSTYVGIRVYNSCGSFIVAVAK